VTPIRNHEQFPAGERGDPDAVRAWRPWVIEEADGSLRMWYSGSDGTSSRILSSVRRAGGAWERDEVAIEPGFSGDDDSYAVESTCVVKIPAGYLMIYGGFDGEVTRLVAATSGDARRWVAQGTILQRGPEDARAATDPCLVITGERWWLYFTGDSGSPQDGPPGILAAVSGTGASWDRLGTVLEPEGDEHAVTHPCVIDVARRYCMFFASHESDRTSIVLATSADGTSWDRRGTVLQPEDLGPGIERVHTPCVVKLDDGSLRMWYSAVAAGDPKLGYRIGSVLLEPSWHV
jgi:predicted GH43/DUF377 family glycosyl hydrolase